MLAKGADVLRVWEESRGCDPLSVARCWRGGARVDRLVSVGSSSDAVNGATGVALRPI